MASGVNDLLQAIHARLAGDAGFMALCTGGIHDRRLDRTAMPYLMVGSIEMRDFSTATEAGEEIFATFEAWSAEGRRQAETIAESLRLLLHDADLPLASRRLVSLRYLSGVSRREAKTALFMTATRFRAVIE